ncbi:hypothetical protein MSG28_009153 [Choristoneura fumiferana]|uniref:Uncharacterized protein n=1 Tax=Choristoneura fumiferana TaxID=7141 RepID=A0ACC0KWI8_CHOFU|nr:hypothetical protein MSG28_009153 [Choristoneura fumiferana]
MRTELFDHQRLKNKSHDVAKITPYQTINHDPQWTEKPEYPDSNYQDDFPKLSPTIHHGVGCGWWRWDVRWWDSWSPPRRICGSTDKMDGRVAFEPPFEQHVNIVKFNGGVGERVPHVRIRIGMG